MQQMGIGRYAPHLLLGLGLLFGVTMVGEAVFVAVYTNPVGGAWWTGFATCVPLVPAILYAGYWLPGSAISSDRYRRVALWTIAGLVAFLAINLSIMASMLPESRFQMVTWVRWAAALGTGVGAGIGISETRAVERAVEAEAARVRATEAEQQEELLSYLNAILRHEFLNIANVIRTSADVVAYQSEEESTVERMEKIQSQTEEMEKVINDVRTLLNVSKGDVRTEPKDVTVLLADELAKLEAVYDDVDVEMDMPEAAHADAHQALGRAFSNLLRNAVEHNDSDTPQVEVAVEESTDGVTVRIADNGPGIPASEWETLSDPELDEESNHGLGLALTTRLIRGLDGSITLADTGSDGTEFQVDLPAAPPTDD